MGCHRGAVRRKNPGPASLRHQNVKTCRSCEVTAAVWLRQRLDVVSRFAQMRTRVEYDEVMIKRSITPGLAGHRVRGTIELSFEEGRTLVWCGKLPRVGGCFAAALLRPLRQLPD